eukprot:CAMPEP_0114232874 /NCGR_PEP_ID=MMETSP0058-20121206/4850_1 /TAXON_ID=36894 /ORGANISM="Pyramimonas parkeae, CCMP726" /LENGTH=646 /DNA_ID=CAMNT_0001344399 /DNA_START=148 /DNA_END=2089 /DNA_ORIENTATION=-
MTSSSDEEVPDADMSAHTQDTACLADAEDDGSLPQGCPEQEAAQPKSTALRSDDTEDDQQQGETRNTGSSARLLHVLDQRAYGIGGSPHKFHRTIGSSVHLLKRLERKTVLEGHTGCVNTVCWTPSGETLISGSDDQRVILWDGAQVSGHHGNVFQAKAMPESGGRTIITCAADGQVRWGTLPEGGGGPPETQVLNEHRGRAHKLDIAPASAHCFASCGEDTVVMQYDLRDTTRPCLTFKAKNMQRKGVGLNAIAYSPRDNGNQIAVAGTDPSVLVYDIRRVEQGSRNNPIPVRTLRPRETEGNNRLHLTCIQYSHRGELLGTYSVNNIYLFAPDGERTRILHNRSDEVVQVYKGHLNAETVKGVSFFGPSDEYVVSGSDCGRIFFWDKASAALSQMVHGDEYIVNCLSPHPSRPLVLATSGIENSAKVWTPTAPEDTFDQEEADQVMLRNQAANAAEDERPSVRFTPEMLMRIVHRYRHHGVRPQRNQRQRERELAARGREGGSADDAEDQSTSPRDGGRPPPRRRRRRNPPPVDSSSPSSSSVADQNLLREVADMIAEAHDQESNISSSSEDDPMMAGLPVEFEDASDEEPDQVDEDSDENDDVSNNGSSTSAEDDSDLSDNSAATEGALDRLSELAPPECGVQ